MSRRSNGEPAAQVGLLSSLLNTIKRPRGAMQTKNRIFVTFPMEDKTYRDFLLGQAKNENSPFEFVNKSVLEP